MILTPRKVSIIMTHLYSNFYFRLFLETGYEWNEFLQGQTFKWRTL